MVPVGLRRWRRDVPPAWLAAAGAYIAFVAAHPVPPPSERRLVAELIVRDVQGDLLEVEPLDLGPGAPATAALEHERGPDPGEARERGDYSRRCRAARCWSAR
jgi:hypothetical protein